jgi:hypothetical protein
MEVRYKTIVDKGVDYSPKLFSDEVRVYLADPDGWISEGYSFKEMPRKAKVTIHLSSPEYLKNNGCRDEGLSCADMGGPHMFLNAMRWTEGASSSKLTLKSYRQYMVSHEMGHILGYDHVNCPAHGYPAPIMMQQTKGIAGCTPNTKLTASDLTNKKA